MLPGGSGGTETRLFLSLPHGHAPGVWAAGHGPGLAWTKVEVLRAGHDAAPSEVTQH